LINFDYFFVVNQ